MRFEFNEKKAAQAAAHLLGRAGGSMPYMKLLKLLYLADRENLVERGLLITGDRLVAMERGMVLSHVLNLVRGKTHGDWWPRYIQFEGEYDVSVTDRTDNEELSEFEISLLDKAFDSHGHMDKWDLVEHLHDTLGEWKSAWTSRPEGAKSVDVSPEDVLRAAEVGEDEIAERVALAADVTCLTHAAMAERRSRLFTPSLFTACARKKR